VLRRDHDPGELDASVPKDVVDFLRKLIPRGVWLHDRQDGNGMHT